ncbi:Cro/Cl family transcriptional regulator [Campylobacter mucosalis]|uniref:Crp/Fnr family transcriptional regulator n=1 Tax=Campylobacter mucosalis TaxID=202 RepID=UPI0004D890B2|nr:Crp/Fnr family transcriptional regulator [Campylobacter mucosalis]KEA45252.1 Cro/Cl family transcriptional regulator [Campylobacter mucosalis]QKF63738.1 transcriptional regulator, Crp/Fnr family [Campylobacter mucosalis]
MGTSRLGLPVNNALKLLDQKSSLKHELFAKSAVLYTQTPKLVLLKTGSAKLCFFEDGEEFILYNIQKENLTILDDTCAIEFLEESEVFSVGIDEMDKLLSDKGFALNFTDSLIYIIILQRQIIRSILFESAKGRIANFLIELATEQDLVQNGYYYIFLPFSLKVLSSFVGLKRQSASTIFNELIKDDIIRRLSPHEFLIVNFEKLKSYTN